eukprot:scaffold3031_cov136-Skeletonema_menzelii.AAC.2
MIVVSSIFCRHHHKLAPLTIAAADVSRQCIASPRDIATFNTLCNNDSHTPNIISKCRFLSSTQRYRSDDTTGSKVSNNDNMAPADRNNNNIEFLFGGSNFQHMLQYQNMSNQSRRSLPKKPNIQPKKQDQLTAVHKQTQSIRYRQHSKYDSMRPRQVASRRLGPNNRREDTREKNADDATTIERTEASSKRTKVNTKSPKVASSDWILVSNTPPMSKLSDIISGIEKIIAIEMDKGVIDLERIEDYISSGVNLKQRRGNLDRVGARESFYATEKIDLESGIPIWEPNLEDGELPSHMVMEARLHLSPHARPKGWFLRLPSRSIVHALLNHNREAEKALVLERRRMESEENLIKTERRKWRQGLWKGVWGEHENKLVLNQNKKMLDKEKEEEWNLAFGVASDERLNVYDQRSASVDDDTTADGDEETIVVNEDGEESISLEEDPHAIAFAYLERYAQFKPYPEQFKSGYHATSSGYHRLTCGSAQLEIEEFHPEEPHASRLRSWDHASFHISPILNLSDSVVRIETEALGKSVDDIQYLFRGYDLESIFPEKASSTPSLPPSCASYVKSLGWNVNGEGNNVDILVDGRAKPVNARHTFLVRFASASSARMAVRDELRFRQGDDMLTMTQFPSSWL